MTISENAISDPSEESVGTTMQEANPPANAPPVNVQALQIAQMSAPLVMLAYTWRSIPVEATTDEVAQVSSVQAVIKDFPGEPSILLTQATDYDHRAYVSVGTIPDFAGKGATRNSVIIGFPGTETIADIKADIGAAKHSSWSVNGKSWDVATGFLTRYNEHMEEEDFKSQLLKFVQKRKPEYIYIVGHSLGGAIASICGADLVTNDNYKGYKIVVVTFGAPRAFTWDTATAVNNYFKLGNTGGHEFWRFLQYGDTVPSLPMTSLGYEHVGRPFYLTKTLWIPGMSGGKWELKEQKQDFSAYSFMGFSGTVHTCTTAGTASTHFMSEYECRLEEVRTQAKSDGLFNTHTSVRVAAFVNDVLARLDQRILAFGGVFVSVAFLFLLRARKQAQEDSVYIALMNSTEQEI